MNSRVALGLRPKNSPSLTVLQHKKSADNSNISPSKLLLKRQATSPAPPSIVEENKENGETQTVSVETSPAVSQTDVTVQLESPKITAEDLTAEKPTANYFRVLAEGYEEEVDHEQDEELKLDCDLDESMTELETSQRELAVLKEVEADIEEEQKAGGSE